MLNAQWLAISEAEFQSWIGRALRRQGYLVSHANQVATCPCCRRRRCPDCNGRAVAKTEPGMLDVFALNPLPDVAYPLIYAELKTERGTVPHQRGATGRGQNRRILPSQRDWINAARMVAHSLRQRGNRFIMGELWRPHDARRIQETVIHDDGREREPWSALDAYETERRALGLD